MGVRRKWTAEEEQLLLDRYNEETAQKIAHRLHRSLGSVQNRAQKLHIDRRIPGRLSMNAACEVLGMPGQHQMVKRWITAGLLPAGRKTGRGQRNDEWVILEDDLNTFLRAYPWMVDADDVLPPYRFVLGGRWITLVEAFRRGAAFPSLMEHGCKAGLVPEAQKRMLVWMIPESILPRLVEGRRLWTDDALHRRQKAMYERLQRKSQLVDRKKEILRLRPNVAKAS